MKGTIKRLIKECDGIPRKWGSKFPSHRNDFKGEQTLGVMIAINKYGTDVDIKMVRTIVGRRCQEYISRIPAVRIPPTTGRRLKAKDMDTMVSTTEYLEDLAENPVYLPCDIADVTTTICTTESERVVLTLRLDGFNQVEIEAMTGIKQQRVSDIIKKIRRQFNDTKCIR